MIHFHNGTSNGSRSLVEPTIVKTIPAFVSFLLTGMLILLAVVGVAAVFGRTFFLSDLATRADSLRGETLRSWNIHDPFADIRKEEARIFDSRYDGHPVLAFLHVLPGGVFLILSLLQFSSRFRSRYIRFHRWSGRMLMIAGFLFAASGLYLGIAVPYAGWLETITIFLFAILFLNAISRAYVSIRNHRIASHRMWMIRAFAIGIGISTVRIVMFFLDLILTPLEFHPRAIFLISIWIGWTASILIAELWIRYTAHIPIAIPVEQ